MIITTTNNDIFFFSKSDTCICLRDKRVISFKLLTRVISSSNIIVNDWCLFDDIAFNY